MSQNKESNNTVHADVSDFIRFMNQHVVSKDEHGEYPPNTAITHTTFNDIILGTRSYQVLDSELTTFYNLYHQDIYRKTKPASYNIIEQHSEVGPLIVDIDFKFDDRVIKKDSKGNIQRQFTDVHIRSIVDAYMTEIENTFNIDRTGNKLLAFVFTREAPYYDQARNIYKDGIHIYFPNIVSLPEPQFMIRENVIRRVDKEKLLDGISHINELSDVFDKAVIQKSGIYIFMSTKVKLQPYYMRVIYEANRDRIDDMDVINDMTGKNTGYFFNVHILLSLKSEAQV